MIKEIHIKLWDGVSTNEAIEAISIIRQGLSFYCHDLVTVMNHITLDVGGIDDNGILTIGAHKADEQI